MGEMEISVSTRLSPKEPFETEMGRQRHQQNLSLRLPVSSPTSLSSWLPLPLGAWDPDAPSWDGGGGVVST